MTSPVARGPLQAALAALLAVLALLTPGGLAQGSADLAEEDLGDVALQLEPTFEMRNLTLLIGALTVGTPELSDLGVTDASALTLPEGTLTVCPVERGSQGLLPTLEALDGECRDGEAFEDPQLRFAGRTWLRFAGEQELATPPAAALNVIIPSFQGGTYWGMVPVPGELGLEPLSDPVRFGAEHETAEVLVVTDQGGEEQVRRFNGTDWGFVFDGDGPMTLEGRAFYGWTSGAMDLRLAPSGRDDLGDVLDPRALLDLQEAALGADAREPVRNATAVVLEHGRVPRTLDPSVLGHLNGTADGIAFDPDVTSFARLEGFRGTLSGGELTGRGMVTFASTADGLAVSGATPADPPWLLIGILWALALFAILKRDRPAPRDRWTRRIDTGLMLVLFVLWDLLFQGWLGTSAVGLLIEGGDVAHILALFVFEAVALGLGVLALLVPLKAIMRRSVGVVWPRIASSVALVLFLIYVMLRPAAVLALAHLVARL